MYEDRRDKREEALVKMENRCDSDNASYGDPCGNGEPKKNGKHLDESWSDTDRCSSRIGGRCENFLRTERGLLTEFFLGVRTFRLNGAGGLGLKNIGVIDTP